MAKPKMLEFPALYKFVSLYWHEDSRLLHGGFDGALQQFRHDAESRPETARFYKECVAELREAFRQGAIRKKLPRTVQVEFWGRSQAPIRLCDYEEVFGKQDGAK